MFLDSCPAGDLETKLTTGKGAIFDIETWHATNHAISQQEAVRCRPSETVERAIFDPKPLAILQDEGYPTGDYPVPSRIPCFTSALCHKAPRSGINRQTSPVSCAPIQPQVRTDPTGSSRYRSLLSGKTDQRW